MTKIAVLWRKLFSYKLIPMFLSRSPFFFPSFFLKLSAFLAFCFALSACQKPKHTTLGTESTQVKIPVFENGQYQWKVVALSSLDGEGNPKNQKYIFQVEPKVVNGRLQGKIHRWNFLKKSDGVFIPQDFLTMQMASISYHLEQLELMDEAYGSSSASRWPLDVALQVRSVRGGKMEKNNASYEMNLHALLFQLPEGSELPLYANGGVIAHEYFHVLFSEKVLTPLRASTLMKNEFQLEEHNHLKMSDPSSDHFQGNKSEWQNYHFTLLRGLNEGLADLWGYLYSGDEEFVGRSLPLYSQRRKIESSRLNIPPVSVLMAQVQSTTYEGRIGISYALGNMTASFGRLMLEELQQQKGLSIQESKQVLGRAIIEKLPTLMGNFQSLQKDKYLSISDIYSMIYSGLDFSNNFEAYISGKGNSSGKNNSEKK